ncbi:MAG: hypothetical protein Q7T24_05280 [Deltaproteobacteria bacterium]|nr:hypothetical protein [Deltaproteobacteria bacterium]
MPALAEKTLTIRPCRLCEVRKSAALKDLKKFISAPLDISLSHIAYSLDRGASYYSIYKKD